MNLNVVIDFALRYDSRLTIGHSKLVYLYGRYGSLKIKTQFTTIYPHNATIRQFAKFTCASIDCVFSRVVSVVTSGATHMG